MAFDPDAWLAQNPSKPFDPDAWLKLNAPKQQAPAPVPEQQGPRVLSPDDNSSDFMRGISNYLPQLQETFGGAQVLAGRLAQKVGAEETGGDLIKRGVENLHKAESKTVVRKTDEFTEALKEGIIPLITDWLPYQIGSGAANLAETLGMVAIGAGVGAATGAGVGALPGAISGAVAKNLVKKGIIEAAEKMTKEKAEKHILDAAKKELITMGSAAGMGGQAVLHGAGETTSRAVQEAQRNNQTPEDINLGRLVPAAIVHSVADYFVNKIGIDALKIGEKASNSLIAEVAKRIAVTGGKEILPEEIQTVAERFGANLSIADAEALKEYINTAAASFGMAVLPGTVGGTRNHFSNQFAKAAKEQAEREEAEKQKQQTTTPAVTTPAVTTPAAATPATPADIELNSLTSLQNAPPGGAVTTTPGTPPTGTPPPTNLPPAENKEQLAAFNYLQSLADDPSKQPVPRFLVKHLENLGIQVDNKAPNFRATALQAIADKLTENGVTVPDLAPIIANLPQSKKAEAAAQTGATPPAGTPATPPVFPKNSEIAANPIGVATKYLDDVAAGVYPKGANYLTLKQIVANIGIAVPEGKGYNARAIEEIKKYLPNYTPPGAPNVPTGTIETPTGTSPSVATQSNTGAAAQGITSPDTSGVGNVATSVTPTDVGEGTKPNSVGAPAVPLEVNLQDLSQADRDMVIKQRQILNDAEIAYINNPSRVTKGRAEDALLDLHQLEDDFEITRSELIDDNEFFAEPLGPFRSRQEQRDTANDYALSLEREETRKQEEQRQRDLEASYVNEKGEPKGPMKYSFATDEMENQYNQTYTEIAEEAQAKNATRIELDVAKEEAQAKFNAAQEKAQKIEVELKAAREQNDESRVQELEKEQEKADNEETDTSAALAEAEVALERHGPRLSQLPPWSKLSPADKDLYFSLIKYGNRPEHREAGKKLQAYRALTHGRGEGYIKANTEQERKEQQARKERDQRRERITNNYEYNREAVEAHFKFKFPLWNKLTTAQKLAYLNALKEKGDTNEAGVQQDYAFARLAERLIHDNKSLTEEQQKKAEADINKRELEMIRMGVTAQEKFQRLRDTAEPYVPFSKVAEDRPLTAEAIKLIKDNELQKLLQAFRSAPTGGNLTALIHKGLAQALFAMKLSTTFEIVDVIRDNKGRETDAYGSYDPLTNKIRLAPNGLTMSTILHELTHAATVQVLYKYSHGNQLRSQLTEDQVVACFQLEQLMEEAKDYLGKSYPTAFKNVYEFIAYAMTEPQFQRELNRISPSAMGAMKASNIVAGAIQDKLGKEPGKIVGKWREWTETLIYESLLPTARTLWTSLSRAIAKAVGYNAEKQANGQINFLVEISEIFSKIAMPQEGAIDLGRLEAKAPATTRQTNQAPPTRVIDLNNHDDDNYTRFKEKKVPLFTAIKNTFTTKQGFVQLATKFANNRYAAKIWEKARDRANLINFDGPLINAVYTLLTLAPARGRAIYNSEVDPIASELRTAIEQYAKAMNLDVDKTLARLHKILEVLHNPERSMVKFLLSAPLDDKKKLFMVSGKPSSAADVRTAILNQLNRSQNMTQAQALQLRSTLESIVFQTQVDPSGQVTIMRDANGNPLVNTNNVVATGFSPDNIKEIDPSHQTFNMTNLDPTSIKNVMAQYRSDPNKALVDKIISDMRRLNEKTIELDKQSNYWSKPVDNRKNFYNFQNYVSFKGKGAHTQTDEMLDFETMKKNGKEFQQIERPMSGRETAADNPLLHAMAYATQAALRAGRKDVTLAIKNAIEQGLMSGRVSKKKSFEERDDPKFIESLPKERTLFHFNEDGSLQVIEINDNALRESIRRTFESTSPLINAANWLTSKVGATHTRYNFNFAPMNFTRDALTNAGAIGADMGPAKAAQYLGAMSSLVANGGLYKAMQVAVLYDKSDARSQQALKGLAASDPFIANMVEFIKEGGMVSYLHGLTIKSNFEQLYKEVGRSGILTKIEQLEKFIDVWTDMFELASRSAAYSVAKADAYANNITGDAAKTKAAAYAKNLANFEQVGDWGKALGSLYMFFRPSATGALRAIESIAPAFRTADRAWESLKAELPENLRQDTAIRDKFLTNYNQNRKNAQIMTASLMGLGALTYTMAFMFADDDDDLGRNPVGTDNMQQWTRYARFHVPKVLSEAIGLKDPLVLQMPWGFGLGAFAASGAQLAAAVAGKQSFGDALANVFLQISLDSFVPIPISRMPATEMPLEFVLDSVAPSIVRPLLEFALNKNGLGQEIYNDQNRRMGDAYTGGDHIPEIYKIASRWMANNTVGDIDISPNTLYFLSNSYLDGIARLFETGTDVALVLGGSKDFKPKVDLPLFGSFFGSRSNVDSREYSAVEKKIQDIEKQIKQFDTDPLMSVKYDINHPLHRTLVDMYNHDKNQELRNLRHQAKEVRLNTALEPKDRDAIIKIINLQENLIKHNLVEIYKAYGVEP